ncbi:heme exporter protein CcmD [Methylobacterium sp. WL120]|uniref:heme exporter protein CcmD n=1 Tax=Methylobacterium sp. WL120 TaxID=2603887 RepID=UPI0011C7379A|nr:heme exporter protein CcmD [Methylobacterium sp. WL120]TXM68387.1 heme exporter protein CcmD [Methylobacterium sp. WL120]
MSLDLGIHGGFILASYAFTALVMAGLVLNAVRHRRAQRRALSQLQAEDRR